MTSASGDVLIENLEDAGTTAELVTPAAFAERIAERIETPAVGVELAELPVSLSETPVSVDPTPAELAAARTGVTPASLCVADYGTVVLPANRDGAELVSLFVDSHVVVLRESDVVPDMETAFDRFGRDPTSARESRVLATGPSATADMGALVEGAHGPTEVTALVLAGA